MKRLHIAGVIMAAMLTAACGGGGDRIMIEDQRDPDLAAVSFLTAQPDVQAITGAINGHEIIGRGDMASQVPVLGDITSGARRETASRTLLIDGADDDALCSIDLRRRGDSWQVLDWDAQSREQLIAGAFHPPANAFDDEINDRVVDGILADSGVAATVGEPRIIQHVVYPVMGISPRDFEALMENRNGAGGKGFMGVSRVVRVEGDTASETYVVSLLRDDSSSEWRVDPPVVYTKRSRTPFDDDLRLAPEFRTIYTKDN